MRPWIAAAALSALSLAPALAAAQPIMPRPEGAILTVTAESELHAEPDIATLNAGVVTQAATAEAALSENAKRMTGVIAALRQAGVPEKDIQTASINLNPQYQYVQNEPPKFTGYQAQNTVTATVRNLKKVGPAIDALVGKGGNQLNGVSFAIDDPSKLQDQARAEAVKKARARAELYANAADLKVARILAISEGGDAPPIAYPMPVVRMTAQKAEVTPVQPGAVSVNQTVTVTFELR
jgi:uncharacterized protein